MVPPDALIIAAGALKPQAEAILRDSRRPDLSLLASRSYGAGQVIFFAYDPSLPPFRGWAGAEDFYRNLFSAALPSPTWGRGFLDWNMAQQAAQTLPSLGLPSILLICGFLFIYILILGPVNFLLLRKIKRRELGWVTIPGFVVFFSVLVFMGGSLSRGQKPVLNRLAVVQGWSESPYARVDGVLGVYSPNRTTYEVTAELPTLLHTVPNVNILQTDPVAIHQTAQAVSAPGLRVDVGGVYSLGYQGITEPPKFDSDLILAINEKGVILEGTITNQSQLVLEDARLLTMTSVLDLGSISAGNTISVDQFVDFNTPGNSLVSPGGVQTIPGLVPPYTTYAPTNFIEQILGTLDYYSNRQTFRKYSLLVAAMSYSPGGFTQANEIYLIGWSKAPVANLSLGKKSANSDDLTLYILGFNPPTEFRGKRWTLTPGFFRWASLDPLQTNVSPYNQYFYSQTRYALIFSPRQEVDFSRVDSLVLHLKNTYETGTISTARFSLWNYQIGDWEPLSDLAWGDIQISNPDRFVAFETGSDGLGGFTPGTIRLQIESTGVNFQIEASDFTLVVER